MGNGSCADIPESSTGETALGLGVSEKRFGRVERLVDGPEVALEGSGLLDIVQDIDNVDLQFERVL